ncbi:MAG: YqgE/AlgH family protein [Chitinispirillaceae bacterium]|nr:YqgE/AlgH family protein [Chitinispirillaceae bacterium]
MVQPIRPDDDEQRINQEHLGRLASGVVLLARDVLHDPNFVATVVLVCIYAKEGGTYGLVLNRPSHMPLSEIFDGYTDADVCREVFIGGPVEQDEIQIVQITDKPVEASHKVAPRVYLGGKWEDIDAMMQGTEDSTHLFLGYSGWAAGQLEEEILNGAWDVLRVDVARLLTNCEKIMIPDVRSIGAYLETIRV